MLTIIGGRQTGKTTCLIEMSRSTGYPILTATRGMAENIELQAMKMHVHIPPVLSLSSIPLYGSLMPHEKVIVDELGLVVEYLTGDEVVSASIDGLALVKSQPPSTDLAKLGLWEAFKLWREERKRARSGGEDM